MDQDWVEMEHLLLEARAIHQRVNSILRDYQSPIDVSQQSTPRSTSSSTSWDDLFQRARMLDDRVQRLGFELPSPLPISNRSMLEDEQSQQESEESSDRELLATQENRPPSSNGSRTVVKLDKLSRPTLRPIMRAEPGLPSYKHDPVRRYELYKQEWAKFPRPGENKHSALRWKVREYMLRVDLPQDLNSKRPAP